MSLVDSVYVLKDSPLLSLELKLAFLSCFVIMNTRAVLYDKPGVFLTKPLQIGEYSCHANLEVEPNNNNLRYLIHVNGDFEPLFDLDAGFKNWSRKDAKDYENDLIHLQEWAISQRIFFNNDYKKVFRDAEIVCGRGTLIDIAKTPISAIDPWRIVAVRHDDVIYLHNCSAIDGKSFCAPKNASEAHHTYWGHSFQRMMTSSNPDLARLGGFDDSERVDCRETYSVVYRSDIIRQSGERIKLVYSSEIKAVDEIGHFVDFKTQNSYLFNRNWLRKSYFWWLQCHLAAVDRVYSGFKSDLGIVHKIRVVDRKFLRQHAGSQCDVVMNFLAAVLSEVKKRCRDSIQICYNPATRKIDFEDTKKDADVLIPNFVDRKINMLETTPSLYEGPKSVLTRPLLIGEFSSHADFTTIPNKRNLRRLIHIEKGFKPTFDLNEGIGSFVRKDPKLYWNDTRELQEWAIAERRKYDCNDFFEFLEEPEIVCCRGVLSTIAKTPYYPNDEWRIVAVRRDGVIYLHDCGVVDGRTYVERDDQHARQTYYGHKFHRVMTSAGNGQVNDTDTVDCRETFHAVFRSDLIMPDASRVKLTYSAEIKAVDENGVYVDMKTQPEYSRRTDWLKKRGWFWWLQTHLVGIDRVFVGFKTNEGKVNEIKEVKRTVLQTRPTNECDVVMNFLAKVLSEVKERCEDSLQIRYSSMKVHFGDAKSDTDFLLPEFVNYH